MMTPQQIELYGDLACPFAYVAHYRWRQLRGEYAGRVVVIHRSLSLEYVNREPTPKPLVEAEIAALAANEPGLLYKRWSAPDSAWPVTIWPAFEAVKCAERQGVELADDLAWAIRVALFAESRCISLRHVLLEIAASIPDLDLARFESDFDRGVAKELVIREARRGWEELRVPGSPTFVLPDGQQIAAPGLPDLEFDEKTGQVREVRSAPCAAPCFEVYRAFLDAA
ncbi:MAG TPA: hypothetical protein VIL01_15855 [Thermomicrobiales bacterium]